MSRTMDKETQAGWDRWAKSIARNVAQEQDLALVETIGRVVAEALAIRDARVVLLEMRIAALEARAVPKVAHLRTGTGG